MTVPTPRIARVGRSHSDLLPVPNRIFLTLRLSSSSRGSFASWLIANGESLAYVKDQMGHHSIQITVDTYGHLVPGANRQAVNRLDDPDWRGKSATPAQPELKRGYGLSRNPAISLVGHAGFEPTTS